MEPCRKSWHPDWTKFIWVSGSLNQTCSANNIFSATDQLGGKKTTWWKETECYLEHCKSARFCNPCPIYNDLSIGIMSILFICPPFVCHKSNVYILEQQGQFWVRMSKFWLVAAGGSDSEDVWLLERLYVLSSSRSYKDENLNHLVAHKKIL